MRLYDDFSSGRKTAAGEPPNSANPDDLPQGAPTAHFSGPPQPEGSTGAGTHFYRLNHRDQIAVSLTHTEQPGAYVPPRKACRIHRRSSTRIDLDDSTGNR